MVNNVNFIEALDRNTKGWCNIYQGRGTGAFGRGTGIFFNVQSRGTWRFFILVRHGMCIFFPLLKSHFDTSKSLQMIHANKSTLILISCRSSLYSLKGMHTFFINRGHGTWVFFHRISMGPDLFSDKFFEMHRSPLPDKYCTTPNQHNV